MQCFHAGDITVAEHAISRLHSRVALGDIGIPDVLRRARTQPLHEECRLLPSKPARTSTQTAQRIATSRKCGAELRQTNQPRLPQSCSGDTRRTHQRNRDIQTASQWLLIRFVPIVPQMKSADLILPSRSSAFHQRSPERQTLPMSR